MERRELEEIERFFAASGHRSPMAYLGLDEEASDEEIEAALRKKRSWAQGQQANPKYRAEALFVIKFNAALRRLLIEERETYEAHFLDGQTQAKLDEIDKFIRGALAAGVLTPQIDAAIRVQGRSLDMADHVVEQRINAIANELGTTRATDDDVGGAAATIDFYALLQVSPLASDNEIAEAYRERYRWARNLRDHDRGGKVLGALDDAWRILRDPERRKRYDQRRGELEDVTEEVEKRAGALAQLVGGSDGSTPPRAAPPRTNEAMLADIRARMTVPPQGAPEPPDPMEVMRPSPGARLATPVPAAPVEPPAVATSTAEGEASPEPSPLRLASAGEVSAPIPNISGRTLGLASGPQQLRERQPRLVLPGKTIVRLAAPRSAPVSYTVKVQNGGQGRMPGKLVSDATWLVPDRAWLDPQAREQDVVVEIRPAEMPGNRASATLTIVADHGERRVVSFEVSRRSYVLPFAAALILIAGLAAAYFAMQYRSSRVVDSAGPALHLEIDPPADRVLVDDVLVGAGRTLEITAPEPGRPFRVRIETDGFAAHEELVSLKGTSLDRKVTLTLADRLAWAPPAGEVATLLPEEAGASLRARAGELGACFTDGSPRRVTLRFTLRVTSDGQVRGLDIAGEGVDRQAARDCVARVVRALRLEPFTGTWAQIEVPVELRVGQ
ncbi:MAG: hypothetical protein FJ102_01410 [Deltaproteobacteria bacterium]|nr:hypothetical protein [Deltaproteobacteria bacterium]